MRSMIVGLSTEAARRRISACADLMGAARSVATASGVPELLEIHRRAPTDLVLADLAFTGSDPAGFATAVHSQCERTGVVLTGPIPPSAASRAIAAGAKALVCGPELVPDLLAVAVARTFILIRSEAVRLAAGIPRQATPARADRLTAREIQVLRAMSEGKSNAQIATELFLSVDTVKTHSKRLFRKLGVHDRAHAVAVGFRARLIC